MKLINTLNLGKYYWKVSHNDVSKIPEYLDDYSTSLLGRLNHWSSISEDGYFYLTYKLTTKLYDDNYYGWMPYESKSIKFFNKNKYKYQGILNESYARKLKLEELNRFKV